MAPEIKYGSYSVGVLYGPMGQGSQDPGYGVAPPLQLLRLQRRFWNFRTLGRSWRNHALQLAHWALGCNPQDLGPLGTLMMTGDSGYLRVYHTETGIPKAGELFFLLRTNFDRDIFGWCERKPSGKPTVAVACWRTPSSGSEFPQDSPARCLCPPVD